MTMQYQEIVGMRYWDQRESSKPTSVALLEGKQSRRREEGLSLTESDPGGATYSNGRG